MVTIDFKYKSKGSDCWKTEEIEPDKYFDLDEGEEMEVWSVPEYSKMIDYITSDSENVSSIILRLADNSTKEELIFNQVFWNMQQNSFLERTYVNDGKVECEYIIESLVRDDTPEKTWEILRVDKINGFLRPTLHSFITEDNEGLVDDRIVDTK